MRPPASFQAYLATPPLLPSQISTSFHAPKLGTCPNVDFYTGLSRARPSNKTVDELIESLEGDWEECERNHSWVQWLYPIQTPGVNPSAYPLNPSEPSLLLSHPQFPTRFLKAYQVYLHFLGIQLSNPPSDSLTHTHPGLRRSDSQGEGAFERRATNFKRNSHNLLRVSRLIQSLSLFNSEPHAESLLLFLLSERTSYGWSSRSNGSSALKESTERFFIWGLRDPERRARVEQVLSKIENGETWGKEEYEDLVRQVWGDIS